MRRTIPAVTTLLPLLLLFYAGAFSSSRDDGSITVSPDFGVAGNFGTWTVTYRIGRRGIAEGGGVRVQLPDSWHAGPRTTLRSRSGPAAQLLVYGPSDAVVDRPAELRLAAVDANANPVPDFEGDVRFQIVQGAAALSDTPHVRLARGWGVVTFTPTSPGILAWSSPIWVQFAEPKTPRTPSVQ